MGNQDSMETRPLAGDIEGLDQPDEQPSETDELGDRSYQSRRKGRRFHWLALLTVAVITNSFSGLAGAYFSRTFQDLNPQCAAYTTQYSPVLKERIRYSPTSFNGTFMHEDVYRRQGSPEVDAAWDGLGVNYRSGVITQEEGLRSGLNPAHVRRSEKYGGGFFVNVEGLHHLHCLDLTRKALFYNYPYYKALGKHAFKNDDAILQLHVSHCLDTLRQVLMCNADTGVLGQVWYNKEQPEAFPDFKTTHKCKNFEVIQRWAKEREEPEPDSLPPDYMRFPPPEDVLPETP